MDALKIIEDNYNTQKGSFLFYLRECSSYNKEAFQKLHDSIRAAAEADIKVSETTRQIAFIYGQILKSFLYHLDTNDDYKILNFPQNYNKIIEYLDKSVEYYFVTRI